MIECVEKMKHPSKDNSKKNKDICRNCERMIQCWHRFIFENTNVWTYASSSLIPDDCDMKTEYLISQYNTNEKSY